MTSVLQVIFCVDFSNTIPNDWIEKLALLDTKERIKQI
jgi:hypothetical protein